MITSLVLVLAYFSAGTANAQVDWSSYFSTECWINHANDTGSPTITVKNSRGKIIYPGEVVPRKFDVEVISLDGLDKLEVIRGAPLIDSEHNMGFGCASYISSDPTEFHSSNTYHVDIGELKPGTIIFLQTFSKTGSDTIRGYFYAKKGKAKKDRGHKLSP